MPTKSYTITPARDRAGAVMRGVYVVTWSGLAPGDTGEWFRMPQYADRSIHVWGTLGTGPKWTIEGSNENDTPTDPVPLSNATGTSLFERTGKEIQQLMQFVQWIRPTVTAGTGTLLNFSMLIRFAL